MARTLSFKQLRSAGRAEQEQQPAGRVPFASVYPLVTARAVARAFTYEVDDGVGVGAIVRVPFGRSRARGIVVALHDAPPDGSRRAPDRARRRAGAAGARRARALARRLLRLDAGARARARRAGVAEAAQGAGAAGRAAGARRARPSRSQLSEPQVAAVERIVDGDRRRRRQLPALRRDRLGQDRGLPAGVRRRARARARARSCSCRRSRSRRRRSAACAQRFGERVAILHSGLTEAERRDERARIASGEARIVVGARSAVFAPVRGLGLIVVDEEHDPSYKQDSDPRYDARTVAAKRAALEGAVAVFGSATPRPESWAALERLELGGRIGGEAAAGARRRPAARGRLPALGAAARRAARRRRAARQGDPAAEPARRRAGAALPRVRHDDPLPELRRRARAARRRVAALPPLRLHDRVAPANCPACGSPELARLGAGTQKLERELARELPELELIRLDADAVAKPEQLADCAAPLRRGRRRRAARHADGREGPPLLGRRARRGRSTPTRRSALPDFRAEERTFQLITQLAGRSGRDAPGRVLVQTFQPDARTDRARGAARRRRAS